jgi:hypothetical protein
LGELDTVISSLEDLVRFTRKRASEEPQFADELELRVPGLSPAELDRLATALPGIPASYLECLAHLELRGVTLGVFNLQPAAAQETVEWLIDVNRPGDYLYVTYLAPNRLYHVASWGTDPICVARDLPDQAGGEVVGVDLEGGSEPRLYRAAPSFASAMVAAGRMLELAADPALAGQAGLEQFIASLVDLGFDDEQQESWHYLIGISGHWPLD